MLSNTCLYNICMVTHAQILCNTFKEQAIEIAKQIDIAYQTGLGVHEESLSDLLVNRIQIGHTENFLSKKFTKKEEGNLTGADWLWCIGEPGSWITFDVQAKIMNPKTGNVNYLHYRHGEQYNLLINFCKQFRFIPKYSVYGKLEEDATFFSREMPELRNVPLAEWSFSMVSPKYIKDLVSPEERYISSVLQFSIPWSYLFCIPAMNPISLADGIAHNLENLYWIFDRKYRNQRSQKDRDKFSRINWENPLPSAMVTKDVPLVVLYLLCSERHIRKVPISNVSIYSTLPVQRVLDHELKKIDGQRRWKTFPGLFERAISRIQECKTIYMLPDGR